jgi:hypothetical protein
LANRAAPRNHFSTHPSPVKLDSVLKLGTGKSPELADKNVHDVAQAFQPPVTRIQAFISRTVRSCTSSARLAAAPPVR